jgi:hypothetical protein
MVCDELIERVLKGCDDVLALFINPSSNRAENLKAGYFVSVQFECESKKSNTLPVSEFSGSGGFT